MSGETGSETGDETLEPGSTEPAAPAVEDGGTEPLPPPPSPFARLSNRPGRLIPEALDLLARSSGDIRRGSFYIGLLVATTVAPFVLLVWRVAVDFEPMSVAERIDRLNAGVDVAINVSLIVAAIGLFVAFIESRAVAATLLAARLEGQPLALRDAVVRSRRVFWRIVRATILTTVPLALLQRALEGFTSALFRGESEVSVISAGIVTTILLAPVVYVLTAIVLGDLGAWAAIRRSIRLFRAGNFAALVVALFAWGAQLLTSYGLLAGLDLVLRAADLTSLFAASGGAATAVTAIVLVVLVFAGGTLLFTVAAISHAPQVVMYLALTNAAPGLDAARVAAAQPGSRFSWLTRAYYILVTLAVVVMILGLIRLTS